jgi:hypothetical protein
MKRIILFLLFIYFINRIFSSPTLSVFAGPNFGSTGFNLKNNFIFFVFNYFLNIFLF